MTRTGSWENERLAKVVERYRYHAGKTESANPVIAEAAAMMRDVDICEMWALTQE